MKAGKQVGTLLSEFLIVIIDDTTRLHRWHPQPVCPSSQNKYNRFHLCWVTGSRLIYVSSTI